MKNSNLIQILLVILLVSAPFIYAAFIWQDMPDRVATHFGIDGTPDAYGSKNQALMSIIIMMSIGLVVYFLIRNIEKFDPKITRLTSKDTFKKINILLLMFMSGLSIYIVHSTLNSQIGYFLFVLLGLLFAGIGNFMHSIQPNYFIGLRLPWTLSDDDNWRKTHQLAGKLWFGGGLLVALGSLFLSAQQAIFFMFGTIALMTLIPVVYSYRFFKEKTK